MLRASVLAVVSLVPLVALVSLVGATSGSTALQPREVIVASGPSGTVAAAPSASSPVELPWLLPGDRDPAVSPDGRRIAFTSARDGNAELYVADAVSGAVRRLTLNARAVDRSPAWSPDGRRLAWQSGRDGAFDLFVMDADGRGKRALVTGAGDDVDPAWSPDGARVAFASSRTGGYALWTVAVRGGEPELLLDDGGRLRGPAWSPDGRRIAYSRVVGGNADVWTMRPATLETRRLTRDRAADVRPDWSPDGRRLAFARQSRGRSTIWVIRAAGGVAAQASGLSGRDDPEWTTAGGELAPGTDQLLPDLDQRAPAGLVVTREHGRFRLGFDSTVANLGRGPLRVRGVRPTGSRTMRADQAIELRGGGLRIVGRVGRMRYEPHPPHYHWHFTPFERYELRTARDHRLVGTDRKTGFCLIDRYGRSLRRMVVGPPRFLDDCGALRPGLRRVEQGSSVGYIDRYGAFFHGQDIDVTTVPAGIYVLVHRANPDLLLREVRYSNNAASVRLRLARPGGRGSPPRVTVLRRCDAAERCPARQAARDS